MTLPFYVTDIQAALSSAQDRAKAAMQEASAALGEANEFAQGNVAAATEAGQILSEGLRDLGSATVAQSRAVFESLVAEAKRVAAAKSPSELLELQGAMSRKLFGTALETAAKNNAEILSLATKTWAPLSNRVAIGVEKARGPRAPVGV